MSEPADREALFTGDCDHSQALVEWENGRSPWHCTTDHRTTPCQRCVACAVDRAHILRGDHA